MEMDFMISVRLFSRGEVMMGVKEEPKQFVIIFCGQLFGIITKPDGTWQNTESCLPLWVVQNIGWAIDQYYQEHCSGAQVLSLAGSMPGLGLSSVSAAEV